MHYSWFVPVRCRIPKGLRKISNAGSPLTSSVIYRTFLKQPPHQVSVSPSVKWENHRAGLSDFTVYKVLSKAWHTVRTRQMSAVILTAFSILALNEDDKILRHTGLGALVYSVLCK